MIKKILIIITALAAFVLNMAQAHAQLSANPWAEVNDEEAVAKVYERARKRGNRAGLTGYQAEEAVVIDRSDAYIQPEDLPQEADEDDGFFDKVKSVVGGEDKPAAPLVTNNATNRQKVARQRAAQYEQQRPNRKVEGDESFLPDFGEMTKGIRMPKMPKINVNGWIRKFERASGIDFKKIGKHLR